MNSKSEFKQQAVPRVTAAREPPGGERGGEEEEAEGGEGGPVGEGGGFRSELLVSFNPLETWRQIDLNAVLPFDL